jgi:hypothetical protein
MVMSFVLLAKKQENKESVSVCLWSIIIILSFHFFFKSASY